MRLDPGLLDFLKRFFVSRTAPSTLEGTLSPASDGLVDLGEPHRKFGTIYADRIVGAVSIDHGSNMGLRDQDHPASAIYTDVTNFGTVLSSADDTVQAALDTLDDLDLAEKDTQIFNDAFTDAIDTYIYEHTPDLNLRGAYWSDESPGSVPVVSGGNGYVKGPGSSDLDFGVPVSKRKTVISIDFSIAASSFNIYLSGLISYPLFDTYRIYISNASQELKKMPTTVIDTAAESIDTATHTLDIIVENNNEVYSITVKLDTVTILSGAYNATIWSNLNINLTDANAHIHNLTITTTAKVAAPGDHSFVDHRDVPSSYSGSEGFSVVVRSDSKGLDFQPNDAAYVGFTPAVAADWTGSIDPGDVDNALDQLAARLTDEEAHVHDASVVTYSPAVLGNWNSSADPGNVDDGLDQLAARTKTMETNKGDMFKATYDTDNDGKVDAAESADAVAWSGVTGKPNIQALFTIEGTLTTGAKAIRIPNVTGRTLTISKVYLIVATAPTGAAIIVDIHKNGTTIFTTQSNRPQIAAGATTGSTTTIEVSSWTDGQYLTMEIDQIGSTVAGADITVVIVYA